MSHFLKVVAFSLLVIAFFTGFSFFGVPQIEPAPPPKEEAVERGAMTIEQFVALGKKIFDGKGACTLCHNPVGGRAPALERAGIAAVERMKDARYRGAAKSVEEYLYESLVKPSAYVVAGFGKAGTNDTESPMPDASAGSIRLSEAELRAVVAYLQDLSGVEVTVRIPTDAGATAKAQDKPAQRAPAKNAEELIAQFACTACHKIGAQAGGPIGPDLSRIGASRDAAYLRRAILEPNADVPKGFAPGVMPATYGEQLYARELEVLVAYLAALK
ncbi:MAG: c-type cytochrome [Betaproteobacteria bacterium]|nr:c-type cytochrome [Betaproteobacteria bacterium]